MLLIHGSRNVLPGDLPGLDKASRFQLLDGSHGVRNAPMPLGGSGKIAHNRLHPPPHPPHSEARPGSLAQVLLWDLCRPQAADWFRDLQQEKGPGPCRYNERCNIPFHSSLAHNTSFCLPGNHCAESEGPRPLQTASLCVCAVLPEVTGGSTLPTNL